MTITPSKIACRARAHMLKGRYYGGANAPLATDTGMFQHSGADPKQPQGLSLHLRSPCKARCCHQTWPCCHCDATGNCLGYREQPEGPSLHHQRSPCKASCFHQRSPCKAGCFHQIWPCCHCDTTGNRISAHAELWICLSSVAGSRSQN